MMLTDKLRVSALFLGDVVALYFSLFATLLLRYQGKFYNQLIYSHLLPFTLIFAVWILVFYIAGLYDLRRLRNNLEFMQVFWLTLTICAALAVFFFYLIPVFGITPKTNLFLFLVIFAVAELLWRRKFNQTMALREAPNKVVVVDGNGSENIKAIDRLDNSWLNGLGYKIVAYLDENAVSANPEILRKEIAAKKINLVVVSRRLRDDEKLSKLLYELLNGGVSIRDLPNFYETVARKIPLADLNESWFIENLAEHQRFYDQLKRVWEFLAAVAIAIVLLPFMLLFALIIKITSPGPAIYRQKRVGERGREFTLYKFRSMPHNIENGKARWGGTADARATAFGKFLRYTHLDELPQLWNIIKGKLSFVGPRPERPEFVSRLKEEIPYYEIRLLVKPGVTGWAQIHHHKDATLDDVTEKLQYDIYYIKNRSPVLDLAIILKTIKTLFVTPK